MGKDWYGKGFDYTNQDDYKKKMGALDNHLKMQAWKLDEFQNFTDETFTSLVNQATDVVTAFAVMKKRNLGCFHASMGVLGFNAVARLGIGLATVCSGDVNVKSCSRVLLGLVWGMVEPVSGNAILSSGVRDGSTCSSHGNARALSLSRSQTLSLFEDSFRVSHSHTHMYTHTYTHTNTHTHAHTNTHAHS